MWADEGEKRLEGTVEDLKAMAGNAAKKQAWADMSEDDGDEDEAYAISGDTCSRNDVVRKSYGLGDWENFQDAEVWSNFEVWGDDHDEANVDLPPPPPPPLSPPPPLPEAQKWEEPRIPGFVKPPRNIQDRSVRKCKDSLRSSLSRTPLPSVLEQDETPYAASRADSAPSTSEVGRKQRQLVLSDTGSCYCPGGASRWLECNTRQEVEQSPSRPRKWVMPSGENHAFPDDYANPRKQKPRMHGFADAADFEVSRSIVSSRVPVKSLPRALQQALQERDTNASGHKDHQIESHGHAAGFASKLQDRSQNLPRGRDAWCAESVRQYWSDCLEIGTRLKIRDPDLGPRMWENVATITGWNAARGKWMVQWLSNKSDMVNFYTPSELSDYATHVA